eukprot:12892234-Prorocentrum_lima.AAC.1
MHTCCASSGTSPAPILDVNELKRALGEATASTRNQTVSLLGIDCGETSEAEVSYQLSNLLQPPKLPN